MDYDQLYEVIQERGYQNIEGLAAEITEKKYWYFLEVLPPIYTPKGFLVSEPLTHNEKGALHYHIYQQGDKYFCEVRALGDFAAKKPKPR